MTGKASSSKKKAKGWVVRVTTIRSSGPASVEIYDVAIADSANAKAAVRQFCGNGLAMIEAIKKLPSNAGLRDGDILWR